MSELHSLRQRLESGEGVIDVRDEDLRRSALAARGRTFSFALFFVVYAALVGALVAPSDWLQTRPAAEAAD